MLLKVINLGGRNGKGGGRNKKPNPLKAFGISSERVNPVSMKNMENQCEAGFQCKGTGAITSRDVAQYHKRVGAESRNNRWVTPAQMKNHGQLTCCGACWNWGAEQIRQGAPAVMHRQHSNGSMVLLDFCILNRTAVEAQMDAPRGKPKGPHMKEVHRLEQELVNGSMTLKAKNGAVKVVTAKELGGRHRRRSRGGCG